MLIVTDSFQGTVNVVIASIEDTLWDLDFT